MSTPRPPHDPEVPLDSAEDFPFDPDAADGGAPWADGPGHLPADELPLPVHLEHDAPASDDPIADAPADEIPPSPS